MLILTILRAAESQLPRLRLRHFKVYAAIVCRAVCHSWLTIFNGAACIDTLTAGAVKQGRVMMYINGRVVEVWPVHRVQLSYPNPEVGKYFIDAITGFATIADVKKHLKTLVV
jgi:hypothetical protein